MCVTAGLCAHCLRETVRWQRKEACQVLTTARALFVSTRTRFSAGAQIMSRWALFTPLGRVTPSSVTPSSANSLTSLTSTGSPSSQSIDVRVLVGDGSSYIYLDDARPDPATCCQSTDTGVAHNCSVRKMHTTHDTIAQSKHSAHGTW